MLPPLQNPTVHCWIPWQLDALARSRISTDWVSRALLVCVLLVQAACAGRQPRQSGREATGGFDFYVLALSWAPAFCAHETQGRNPGECSADRINGFVVHGLWPERDSGERIESCAPVPPLKGALIQQMLSTMPDPGLIQHEWRTHGSCTGLPPEEYFATVRHASERIQIPESFRSLHRTIETGPAEIEKKFAAANHLRSTAAIRVQCRQGELREVRVCLTKDLQPRPCGWNVRDCRASQLFVRAAQ